MGRKPKVPLVIAGMEVPPLFPPGDHRKTITIQQLSELSGIPLGTLRDWVHYGTIPGAFQRKKHTKWLFRREPLEKWWVELIGRHMRTGTY